MTQSPPPGRRISRSAIEALDRHGLPAAREVVRRLHPRNLDKAAHACCPASEDLTIDGAEGPLRARLYAPAAAAAPSPLLVYFHGGGFVLCDVESHDALCRRLAAASGMRVLSVDYRLAPEHRFPAMHRDAEAAWAWVAAHAQRLGADPGRLGLGGDSAGGHMAAWTALEAVRRPDFLLLLYPLLHVDEDEWPGRGLGDLGMIARAAVGYIRRQIGDQAAEQSALADFRLDRRDLAGLPPTVIAEMGLDPLTPGIAAFAARLHDAGVPVQELAWRGLTHGALNFAHLSRLAARAIDETGKALARAAGRP